MTSGRPRARLTGGGPTWDLRAKKQGPSRPRPAVSEADVLMALDEAILGMRIALRDGDLGRAREMRRNAWGYVEMLPLGATWRQRRTLGQLKDLLRVAERSRRIGRRPTA